MWLHLVESTSLRLSRAHDPVSESACLPSLAGFTALWLNCGGTEQLVP